MIDRADDGSCSAGSDGYPSDCEVTRGLRELAAGRRPGVGRSYAWRASLERAAGIKLLLLDVDGVLTDGSIIYLPGGVETKAFSTRDGMGIRLARKAGIEVGIITARSSEVVRRRSDNLGITRLYQGVGDKRTVFQEVSAEMGLSPEQVAYVGDDWLDLPVLTRVGLAVAVGDAVPEVREVAHYVTAASGGRGAVREVCDLLVEASGRRPAILAGYLE